MRVPEMWELPERIDSRLGLQTAGRQRAIAEDGHLLLILHEPPGPDEPERKAVYFWRNREGEWRHSGPGDGIESLREHLAGYREFEDAIEESYARATRASDYFGLLERLVPLQRASRNQAAALQVARSAIDGDRELIEVRDEAGDVERSMELLYTDVKNALEFDAARTAEEQARFGRQSARAGHRLNILAALFFPLTALTSVFGMNLPMGLEATSTWSTLTVLAGGVLLGAVMLVWVTGDRRPTDGGGDGDSG